MQRSVAASKKPRLLLLAISYIGFISLGLPDAVIGVAWPSVSEAFNVPIKLLGLVSVASGAGYFISSFFTGRLLRAVSIGALLAGSSFLVAASGFGYAIAPLFVLFLGAAALHGLGSGAIDAGLNNFVARNFSARQMNWLHACYMLGAMLGPMLMTAVLARDGSWRLGYGLVGGAMTVLSLLFIFTRGQWGPPVADDHPDAQPSETIANTLRVPAVWLQMFLFFTYTGLEVSVGNWSYTLLTEVRNVRPEIAGLYVTTYWGSLFVGRVLFGFAVEYLPIDGLLRGCTLAAVAGCLMFAWPTSGLLPLLALIVIGLALAPVFPCLMTRTPQRLGDKVAAHAIGFQVSAAMIGAATLPLIIGLVAGSTRLGWMGSLMFGIAIVMTGLHELLMARPTRSVPSIDG